MKRLKDWKAVRKGDKYCTPACGRGCTYAEYLRAKKAARSAAHELRDVPTDVQGRVAWKVRVWENLGWHYSVYKGKVELHFYSRQVLAFFQMSGPWGGNFVVSGQKPAATVRRLIAEVRRQLKPMVKLNERLDLLKSK